MNRDYSLAVRDKTDIAEGSISDIAIKEDMSLAEAFAGAKRVILLDGSSSMEEMDVRTEEGYVSRHDAAEEQVRRIQREYKGQVALICFSDSVEFCPDGVPRRENRMTAMAAALQYAQVVDDIGIGIDLISDGQPTDGENKTLEVAARFKTPINCIYIGPEGDYGHEFLMQLARATGGQAIQAEDVGIFYEDEVRLLLSSG
jgi:Mg-chelatase subunit ChlD